MNKKLVLFTLMLTTVGLTACSSGGNKSSTDIATPIVSNLNGASTVTNPNGNIIPVMSKENTISTVSVAIGKDNEARAGYAVITSGTIKNNHVKIDGKEVKNSEKLDLAQYGQGEKILNFTQNSTITENKQDKKVESTGKLYLFQQNYSAMLMLNRESLKINGVEQVKKGDFISSHALVGEVTKKLPTTGSYHYVGDVKLYDESKKLQSGVFDYNVDFSKGKGKGKVVGVSDTDIILNEAPIISDIGFPNELETKPLNVYGLHGEANYKNKKGGYVLGFFGEKADEVAGYVDIGEYGNKVEGLIGGKKQ